MYLPVKTQKWVVMALVDSGAEANLISERYLDEEERRKTEERQEGSHLRSYTGNRISSRGKIDLWVNIAGYEILVRFVVVREGSRILLGAPFLRKCRVLIDFGLGWMRLRRRYAQL